ncbi:MAG: PDZ domain-containing protein [Terriglobales bacterium]|jgi:membrane-associated protease RseP (regulator of RpoE activity)
MTHRFLLCFFVFTLVAGAQPADSNAVLDYDRADDSWSWGYGSEEGGGGSAYLGVDIADVSAERLGDLKLKEEHGAEVTMVDRDAPAGKAGLQEHDVILTLNGTAIESAAQLRRMIKETPSGRVVTLGVSRDGQPVTIKVQLADRHKTMAWQPELPHIPAIPAIPSMPDFDLPISVVVVHSGLRSGLMVENITAQLGEFFGVRDGLGVMVRSVEKGSHGEKAGFRAGDVVIRVNNQPVHDTSDFTHALRSSSGTTASVTVIRDKKEQNLTLTLPEKKDSGSLLEDSFEMRNFTAETEQAIRRAGDEMAGLAPAIAEKVLQTPWWKDLEKSLHDSQQKLEEEQKQMQQRQRKWRRGALGQPAEI